MEVTVGQILDKWKVHRQSFPPNQSPERKPFVRQFLRDLDYVFALDDDPNWDKAIKDGAKKLEALLKVKAAVRESPVKRKEAS